MFSQVTILKKIALRSKMECSILEGPDVFSKATNFQNIATSASEARNVLHLGRLRAQMA